MLTSYYKATVISETLTKRETYRLMEQNRTYAYISQIILDKGAKTHTIFYLIMVLGKLDIHMQKNKAGPLPYTQDVSKT
jgi:hypothetical protein